MSIAGNRQYIVVAYDGTIELWDPEHKVRIIHELDEGVKIAKVECNHQGGAVLTTKGQVSFYDHRCTRFQSDEVIVDIASGERDLIMTTASGKFIKLGKRGHFLKSAPPPVRVAIGPAKIAHIASGALFVNDQRIPHPQPIIQVSVGGGHTVFIDDSGSVYGFGNNARGQLGRGIILFSPIPTRVPLFSRAKKVMAGHEHTVILDVNGTVWACGSNLKGQLGKETPTVDDCRFGLVKLTTEVIDIYARYNATLLLFANGDVEQIGVR